MVRFRQCMCAAVALTCIAAAPAEAQQGPFSGLFGGSDPNRTQTLDFRGSLFGAADDDLLAQAPNAQTPLSVENPLLLQPAFQQRGLGSGFNASLKYWGNWIGAGGRFQLSGEAAATEFDSSASGRLWGHTYAVRTYFLRDLTRKTTVALGGGATYAPFFQYAPFLNSGNAASSVSPGYGVAALAEGIGSFDASASITNRPSRKTSVSANVGWRKAQDGNLLANPFGALNSDGTQAPVAPAVPALTAEWVSTVDASAVVTDNFTDRSSISADVDWRSAQQVNRDELLGNQIATYDSRTVHAAFTHKLTRKLSVRTGYGVRQERNALVAGAPWQTLPLLDLGVDYGDGVALSFAQRYTLSLSTGLSVVRNSNPGAQTSTTPQTLVRVDGGATLTRAILRTWSASVGYARGTSYIVGFSQPFFYDSANTRVGGELASRLQFSAGGTYSRGLLAFTSSGAVTSYSGSARLTYGIGRHVGLYAQYTDYLYKFPQTFSTVQLPPTLRRRAASVGISTWLPIFATGSKGSRDSQ